MPLILDNASLKLDGETLDCVVNHLELNPDVAVTTVDTFCGSTDYPGNVKWALVVTLYQSFDAGATEEILSTIVAAGDPVPFEILPYRDQTVSPTNPKFTGEVVPQPYSPINGDAGDASTIDLEWSLTGPPGKVTA